MTTRLEIRRNQLKAKLREKHTGMPVVGKKPKAQSWDIGSLIRTLATTTQYTHRFHAIFKISSYLQAAFHSKKPLTVLDWSTTKDGWDFELPVLESKDWGGDDMRIKLINKLSWGIYESNGFPALFDFLQSDSAVDCLLAMKVIYNLMHFNGLWRLIRHKEPAIVSLVMIHLNSNPGIRLPALSVLHQIATHHSSHHGLHQARIVPALLSSLCPQNFYGVRDHDDVNSAISGILPSEESKSSPRALEWVKRLQDMFQADAFSLWIIFLLALHPNPEYSVYALDASNWVILTLIAFTRPLKDPSTLTQPSNSETQQWCAQFIQHSQGIEAHMVLIYSIEILHLCLRMKPSLANHVRKHEELRRAFEVLCCDLVKQREDPRLNQAVSRLQRCFIHEEWVNMAKEVPHFDEMMKDMPREYRLCSSPSCMQFRSIGNDFMCLKCKVVAYCSQRCMLSHRDTHKAACPVLKEDRGMVSHLFVGDEVEPEVPSPESESSTDHDEDDLF